MQRQDLERMTREQLIAEAERLSIPRPRVLTQPELIDEIIGRTTKNERERAKARGWLGRARDLLARVVDRGLHVPEAARALRKEEDKGWPAPPPPLPTVTLAEIYAAQGHLERALAVLEEVLVREPDHREARQMRARFTEQAQRSRSRAGARDAGTDSPATQKAPSGRILVDVQESAPDQAAPPPEPTPTHAAEPAARPSAPARAATTGDDDDAAPPTTASAGILVASEASMAPDLDFDHTEPTPAVAATPEAPAPAKEPTAAVAAEASAEAPVRDGGDPHTPATGVTEAAPALEEPPLPDRYEVDEIVAIAVDPITLYFYWEVRATTLAHARSAHPDGWLCVRIASVIATWEGPAVETRDLRVDALHGDRFLRDIQPGSNLRVSLGWSSSAGFEPFAIGSEVSAPRAVPVETVAQEVARWEAEPVVAPFQNPRVEPISLPRSTPGPSMRAFGPMPRHAPLASPSAAPTSLRARAPAGAIDEGGSAWQGGLGPIDTGVETWGTTPADPMLTPEEEYEELLMEEGPGWFEGPGGSSELGRSGPGRRMRPVPRRRLLPGLPAPLPTGWPGGASDLYPGGASELSR